MRDFVVWLDSKSAHVFEMRPSGIEKTVVKKREPDHHRRHKNDMRSDSDAQHYYHDLAGKLVGADQLLLMGPGLAKNKFKEYLSSHMAHTLAKKVIGLEKMESFEHKTEKQMLAKARKFFRAYDLFNNPI